MPYSPNSARALVRAVAPFASAVLLVAGISCSGSNHGNVGNASPATLVSECDRICDNVAQCGVALGVEIDCKNACNALSLVDAGCLNPFAGYLTCLSGASSVQCGVGGNYVVVTPPECEDDRQIFLNCTPGPSPVAACIALPGNNSCAASGDERAAFCVGAPASCSPVGSNPLGLGTYCCP